MDVEVKQGKAIADAAVSVGAELLIWSSMIDAAAETNGHLKHVLHFDGKAAVEKYIRGLEIRSAFFGPGFYSSNWEHAIAIKPVRQLGGDFIVLR